MYNEKRPTCVTVIGWTWIILGGFACFSAAMALVSSVMIGGVTIAQDDRNLPFLNVLNVFFGIFPLLALIQIGFAVLGLVSGICFLKLKAWARAVLESLTWLLLVSVLGFMFIWIFIWVSVTPDHGPDGFVVVGAVMGVVVSGLYVVPLGIMLKYLRGPKVRNAISGAAESSTGLVSPDPARSAAPDEPTM